jgi:hypothetical protein
MAILGYHHASRSRRCPVADILIRDVPDEVVAVLDANARRLGLSRTEYLRQRLAAEASPSEVTTDDLAWFADAFGDLADPEVMSRAWR